MTSLPVLTQPAAILQKLEAALAAKAPATPTTATKASSSSTGWWAALVVFVLGIAAAVVYWYIDRKNRQELARLRHDKQVALIQAEQDKTDVVVEGTIIETEKLRQERAELATKMLKINSEIVKVEAQRAADKAAIDRIRSWDDLPPSSRVE